MAVRSCAVCKNVRFLPATCDYSEVTPGLDDRFMCDMRSSEFPYELTCSDGLFSEMREIAARCEMYEPEEG